MLRKLTVFALVAGLLAPSTAAFAQEKRWEITPSFGYKFGGSFDFLEIEALSEGSFKDGLEYGVSFGYNVTRQFSVEAAWNRQASALEVSGLATGGRQVEVFDMNIDQWHGNFVWTVSDATVKPFFLLGLGATVFSPDIDEIDNETKFSFGVGAGIKYFPADSFGLRLQARWAPTYINSNPAYWCYVYCYVVEEANYANQVDVTGGLIFRF